MYRKEALFENAQKLIKGFQVLEMPIIVTEQYPKGLGPTIPEIAALFPDFKPLPKLAFSCWRRRRISAGASSLGPAAGLNLWY